VLDRAKKIEQLKPRPPPISYGGDVTDAVEQHASQ
jgi:hypothetical protein